MVAWIRIGVNLILLAVGVHLAVSVAVRRWVEGLNDGASTLAWTEAVGPAGADRPVPDAALTTVKQRDLFRSGVGEPPPPRHPATSPQPKSNGLSIVLRGTIVGQGQDPMAVLAANRSHALRLYRIGDRIDGAEIREIRREKIVLRINGQDQELALDKSSPSFRTKPSPPMPAVASAPADTDALGETPPAEPGDAETPDTADPPPSELPSGGIVVGDVTPGSLLDHAGLEAGDVIIAVDDEPVDSLEAAVEQLTVHDDPTPVRVQVRRRGHIEVLTLHPGEQTE